MRFAGGFFSSGDGSNRGIGGTTIGGISEEKKCHDHGLVSYFVWSTVKSLTHSFQKSNVL